MKSKTVNQYELVPTKVPDKNGNLIETYKVKDIVLTSVALKNGVDIKWIADDTEFEIWFPKELNSITFPWYQRFFRNRSGNMKIKRKFRGNLKIEPDSELVIYYSIYCSKTDTMAIGGSSPRMLIR